MSAVVWHDVECGSYAADLPLWEELAADAGPVLDLGCGSGRVALHLGRRRHRVVGLDRDATLLAALRERAAGLPVEAVAGDARDFALEGDFGLAIAPMQLVQLFEDRAERVACLRCVAAHLVPGGVAALAIVDSVPVVADAAPPLPDARELDGWVYSSLPVDTAVDAGTIRIRRLRQTVSPEGELSEELDQVVLRALDPSAVEAEAEEAGLLPAGRRPIPATEAHVGSTVVLLEMDA